MDYVLLLLIGIAAATFGSLVGLGGGIFLVPTLIYLGPSILDREFTASLAVGTSLFVLIFTALSSTLTYMKQKKVDFRSGWLYFIASGPAAIVGSSLTGKIQQQSFQVVFGCFMMLMALIMVVREYMIPAQIQWKIKREFTDETGKKWKYGYNVGVALLVGAAVGIISGLFGIGGGLLFVPVMVLLFAYPPHVATATSMFVIFLSAMLGSVMKIYLGEVDWLSVAALAPGALIGGWLGARIAARLSGKRLLWLLRVTLFFFAVRMIWDY